MSGRENVDSILKRCNPSLAEKIAIRRYYLVTDGLSARFPGRVMDFPPDETSLLGASQGLAQSGRGMAEPSYIP